MAILPDRTYPQDVTDDVQGYAVGWTSIFAGAVAAVGATLILTPVGSALGFAAASPWNPDGEGAKALSAAAAIWMIVTQWVSSGVGGYLTGRMRTRWNGAHTHEVFFRDTVHGFVTWVIATLFVILVIMSAMTHLGHSVSKPGDGPQGKDMGPGAMYVDSLFRSPQAATDVPEGQKREAMRILGEGVVMKSGIPANDRNYLAQIVSTHAGISPADADARIDETITKEKAALDAARKRASELSLMFALSLLVGAFVACSAAALGGRDRDNHYTTGRLTPL